jgi:hypothetical protein
MKSQLIGLIAGCDSNLIAGVMVGDFNIPPIILTKVITKRSQSNISKCFAIPQKISEKLSNDRLFVLSSQKTALVTSR